MSLIELPRYKLIIVCICRSPDGNLGKFLDKKDITDLLLRYNLVNTVKSPTRITPNTNSLLYVVIINGKHYKYPATVIEFGLSDHLAQKLSVQNISRTSNNKTVLKRSFGKNSIREFKHLLNKETWQGVLTGTEVNTEFEVFMNIFKHSFDTAFPLEYTYENSPYKNGGVTQEIKTSSKKITFTLP